MVRYRESKEYSDGRETRSDIEILENIEIAGRE